MYNWNNWLTSFDNISNHSYSESFEDIDDCSPKPCQNGGTCTDGINSFTCSCVMGYSGNNCQTSENLKCTCRQIKMTGCF